MVKVNKISKSKKKPLAARRPRPEDDLTLPTEKTEVSNNLQDYTLLLYGAKKIGKTTLASCFPDTFFMFCEPGGKGISVYGRPVRNWIEFKKYVELVCADKRFKTVVVDTADYSYEYCLDYVCKKLVIDHPSEEGYGKGWKAVRKEYVIQISKLLHSGKGVIFISHAKEEEIQKRGGEKFHRTSNTLSGQAKDVLEGLVDIWGYYCYEKSDRFLILQGDDFIDAGHRLKKRFKYTDGTRVRKIAMGSSEEEGYENFMKAFRNELKSPETKKIKLKR